MRDFDQEVTDYCREAEVDEIIAEITEDQEIPLSQFLLNSLYHRFGGYPRRTPNKNVDIAITQYRNRKE